MTGPERDALAESLFTEFSFYREHTLHVRKCRAHNSRMSALTYNAARKQLMLAVVDWCAERAISPGMWIYALFAMRQWGFPPKLEHAHLCSEKLLPRFFSFRDYAFYQKRQAELREIQNPLANKFDPNLQLSLGVERLKEMFLRTCNPEGCMAAMQNQTFGYHPKSWVCNHRCSAKEECAQRLQAVVPFDIMALRSGVLTPEKARQAALGAVCYAR